MAVKTDNNMGIGLLGTALLKRKYRWLFEVYNIGGANSPVNISGSFVKVANRPQLEVEETELNFLNGKTWIPGKATFQQLSVTYYDVAASAGGDAASNISALFTWLNRVYNFSNLNGGITATQGNSPAEYCGKGKLTMLDGGGFPLEQWTLINCWPVSINFGDLDYSSSEECTIELNLRYSYALYENACAGKPLIQPAAAACTGILQNY